MSKAHMIVLGFLNEMPMYGYRIGQIVESKKFSVWAGIKLPSIYKAMQTLELKGYIEGEQKVEGNNPPRTVYSINDKGRKHLADLICGFLNADESFERDFWLALSFAKKTINRSQLREALENRIAHINGILSSNFACQSEIMITEKKIPIIHRHLVKLGDGCFKVELQVMQELLEQMKDAEYDDFFKE